MKIHEHQGKELFRNYQIPIPNGLVAFGVEEALKVAQTIQGPRVVKAQIHAGGRGKGGGVKLAKTTEEVRTIARSIFGMNLVTPQTGPEGTEVKRLLIEEGADISEEHYLAITLDRNLGRLVIIASQAGGLDIERVAEESPQKIFREWISPDIGLRVFQTRRMASRMGYPGETAKQFGVLLSRLNKLFLEKDCSLVEINPLVVTKKGSLIALDAKVNFDENALFRHPELHPLRDPNEEDANEAQAKKFDLSYISLDGNIGCMVNGAGLAMATMDIIKLEGGSPANFLDVGGGATEDRVREAFKIILQDPKVKAILVNIFGGIMKCDVIAIGIVSAAKELNLTVPLVVRLEGTNVELGKKILNESHLKIISATGMKDAAQKAVTVAGGKK